MKRKSLVCILLAAALLMLAACSGNNNNDNEQPIEAGDDALPVALAQGEGIVINVYCHGIKTSLDITSNTGMLLVNALDDTLKAAQEGGLFSPDGSGLTAQQLLDRYTCLELVYSQPITTSITSNDHYLQTDHLVYAIYTGEGDQHTLCLGDIPYCSVEDVSFACMLDEYCLNLLQKAEIKGNNVSCAGFSIPYLNDVSDDIPKNILGPIIYNTFAFYRNSCNDNIEGNAQFTTSDFMEDMRRAARGETLDEDKHGASVAANLDSYFEYTSHPASLQVLNGDGFLGDYVAYLSIDQTNTLQLIFMEKDGYPYLDACYLMAI